MSLWTTDLESTFFKYMKHLKIKPTQFRGLPEKSSYVHSVTKEILKMKLIFCFSVLDMRVLENLTLKQFKQMVQI
uniref:Uncharacterized protein n=1 Tax=Anguilla anguilla TaxID=7936 RepID=A0A0E9P6K3_ANGAN